MSELQNEYIKFNSINTTKYVYILHVIAPNDMLVFL